MAPPRRRVRSRRPRRLRALLIRVPKSGPIRQRRAGAVLVAGLLTGLTACTTTPRITNPRWASLPSPDAMGGAYPPLAALIGVNGWAELNCTGLADQRLANCVVLDESPAGMGFGRAALSVTSDFRLEPRQIDGAAAKARVVFSVRFALDAEDVPPSWTGLEPDEAHIEAARRLTGWLTETKFDHGDEDLGVDADRAEATARTIVALEAEYAPRAAQALALGLARILTRPQIDALVEGRPPPGKPPEMDVEVAAFDQVAALEAQFRDRLKAWYCGRYDCKTRPSPRGDQRAVNAPPE